MWFIDRLRESEYSGCRTPNIFKDAVTIINIRLWIRDENNYILVKFWPNFRNFSIFCGLKSFFLVKSQFLIQRSISKRSSLKGVNEICTFVRVRFSNICTMYVFVKLPFWSDFKDRVDWKWFKILSRFISRISPRLVSKIKWVGTTLNFLPYFEPKIVTLDLRFLKSA